ncbi:MAG: zinc-binding alcohol dehydrogenase family protein [Gammaproteobacteria bacterium]|nr:zinc-binding alcohol dehydrogenase family protein [Gammaproteobacteria bacterium]
MKAIGYLEPQSIEHEKALLDVELPMPEARGRDLLVKIRAVSVNPVDVKVRANMGTEGDVPKVLGWDAVGEVVAVGESTELFNVGDVVWYAGDFTRAGSNAEFQLVDERIVGKKPASLTAAQAAALPLTTLTAWELLFDRLGFQPFLEQSDSTQDEPAQLLIVGAAGGVGSILVQLARQLTNITVIATASRESSQAWVTRLGAHHVINHHEPLLPQLQAQGIESVSHVISLNQTDQHFDQLIEALAPQGKFALIDDPKTPLDVMKLKFKSLSLHWEMMFTRSMYQTKDMQAQHDILNTVAELIDDGVIVTTLGEHYGQINAENLKRAHAHIESNQALGKIVLEGF